MDMGHCAPLSLLLFLSQTYVSEISTTGLRSTLNAGISGGYNLGMLAVFSMGAACHWRVLAAVSAAFPMMGMALLCCVPESPVWFVTKGTRFRTIL